VTGILKVKKIYTVELGVSGNTDSIARNLRNSGVCVNKFIKQENFVLLPRKIHETIKIGILDPGRGFTEKEALYFLSAADLRRPTQEYALRFMEQYGKTKADGKTLIVFMHQPWRGPFRRVLCADLSPMNRKLELVYPSNDFKENCSLAGVLKSVYSGNS
jgi:hypothetical protein